MVNFNFSFDPGTSLQQMVGFEIAGRLWSSYLTDPITVNLQVGVSSSLGSNVIGGALPGIVAYEKYSSFTSALKADATSADDQTALKQIYGSSFSAVYQLTALGGTASWMGTSSSINLTRADAKALGLINANDSGLDGYMLFGSLSGAPVQWNYDYTRSTPAPANSLDFLTTALHEIGHTLGFVSGLDSPGWIDSNFGSNLGALLASASQNVITTGATPLDLFRYSVNSSIFGTISDTRNLTLGGTKAFSLGIGTTPIAYFSTGDDTSQGGNGYEASHWYTNTVSIEAPTLKTGTRSSIAAIDLQALDVIGYNLASTGINTAINLATLQSQAQQALASRLGQTVSWLNANSTTAAQSLTQDRSQDIYTMAVNSQIYDLNRITPPTPGVTASLTYSQVFQEQGLFETIDALEVLPVVSIQPSLEALVLNTTSNLNQITPPTPGVTAALIINLPGLDLNRPTPPTPGVPPTVIINLPSLDLNRPTPPTPGVPPTAIINLPSSLSQRVQALATGTATTALSGGVLTNTTNYFYGNSKPVVYEGVAKSGQQQFASPPVLVNLSAVL